MFVLRFWRANKLGDSLSRMNYLCSVNNSGARHLSEPLCPVRVCNLHGRPVRRLCATRVPRKCWNCKTVLDSRPCLFCKNCSLIQSSEQQNFNYFELFDIPDQYDIDTGQLTLNFRKLQNLIHPDKFSNKTKEEKLLSESLSSLLNKAYRTLINPLSRGFYMLNARGLNVEEGSVTMDTTFLSEIMEWNEQVEEADTKESLENLKKDVDLILVNLYKELSQALSENNINQAKLLLSKAKYFSTLIEKIKEIDM